jgi:hypothetical protein
MIAATMTEEEKRRALLEMYPSGSLPAGQAAISGIGEEFGFEPVATRAEMPPPEPEIRISRMPESQPLTQSATQQQAPAPQQKSGGFNWQRAIAGLTGRHEGIAAYDRSQLAQNEDARKQAREPFERRLREEQESDIVSKRKEREDKNAELRAAMDPSSDLSRMSQEQYKHQSMVRAKIASQFDPGLAQLFTKRAEAAGMQTALNIQRMQEADNDTMGNVLKMIDAQAKQAQAAQDFGYKQQMLAATSGDRAADNARQSAALDEQRRHNTATENLAGQKLELRSTTPPAKLMQGLRENQSDLRMINELIASIEAGKNPYTGVGAGSLTSAKNVIDSALSATGVETRTTKPEHTTFLRDLGQLKAMVRKPIYGAALSKFDISDSSQWLPQDGDASNILLDKLGGFKKALDYNMELQKTDYETVSKKPYTETGSNDKEAKAAKARAALKDPNASEKAKRGAAIWLKENGYAQ